MHTVSFILKLSSKSNERKTVAYTWACLFSAHYSCLGVWLWYSVLRLSSLPFFVYGCIFSWIFFCSVHPESRDNRIMFRFFCRSIEMQRNNNFPPNFANHFGIHMYFTQKLQIMAQPNPDHLISPWHGIVAEKPPILYTIYMFGKFILMHPFEKTIKIYMSK